MTLRTIESEFSEALQKEMVEETHHDLTLDGPMLTKLHPRMILGKLTHKYDPEKMPEPVALPGWFYDCHETLASAKKTHPSISFLFDGRPWAMKEFLESGRDAAIVDFHQHGALVLSRNDIPVTIENTNAWHTLPSWASYALSPEVWGTQGKWTRFHARLHKLFTEHNLLKPQSKPLYYVLSEEASKLKNHGFEGTLLDKSYVLVLPWSFSLTALEKLEKMVRLEFPHVHS